LPVRWTWKKCEYFSCWDDEVDCVGSSEPHKLGPIDKWTRPIDPKLTQAEALHQQKINKELWKKRTHEVQQYVARWV
jgi:hypothetical protein